MSLAGKYFPILLFAFTGSCMTETQTMYFSFDSSDLMSKMPDPSSFYVEGTVKNGTFIPTTTVLGAAQFDATGQKGWFELTSRQFYPMHAGRAPHSPYVEGYLTKNGFVPSSREIK